LIEFIGDKTIFEGEFNMETPTINGITTVLDIPLAPEIVKEAEEVFEEEGTTLVQAIAQFIEETISPGGLTDEQCDIIMSTPEMQEAIRDLEAKRKDPNCKGYRCVDEFHKAMISGDDD
jgi:hypothetical protein